MLRSSLDLTTADGVADSYLVLPEGEPKGRSSSSSTPTGCGRALPAA